jgi:hypothetical protein
VPAVSSAHTWCFSEAKILHSGPRDRAFLLGVVWVPQARLRAPFDDGLNCSVVLSICTANVENVFELATLAGSLGEHGNDEFI